jgi:hypothetical protein
VVAAAAELGRSAMEASGRGVACMWALLSDPGHGNSFASHGEPYAPMRQLLLELAQREYADQVYGVKSLTTFGITTAPNYETRQGHDTVGIMYDRRRGLFAVGYSDCMSTNRSPRPRETDARTCEIGEAADFIDRYILRLILSRRHADAEPGAAADRGNR